jgi:hypothetical protein
VTASGMPNSNNIDSLILFIHPVDDTIGAADHFANERVA